MKLAQESTLVVETDRRDDDDFFNQDAEVV